LAKVYVSSTIADLTEERRAVLDWLRLARHQAVDSYLPDSDTVRDSCLDDVAGCDLYPVLSVTSDLSAAVWRRTVVQGGCLPGWSFLEGYSREASIR
jgi:Domain of unknown function (DUF4062)